MTEHEKTVTFTLTGWKAVCAIALLIGFVGFRTFGDRTVTDQELLSALRLELQSERTRERLPDLQRAVSARDEAATAGLVEEVTDDIEFVEVTSGKKIVAPLVSDEAVVKVRYRWNRGGSVLERYYRVERTGLKGWYVHYRTGKVSYLLSRF